MNQLGVQAGLSAVLVACAVLSWPLRAAPPWRAQVGGRGRGRSRLLGSGGAGGAATTSEAHLVPETLELLALALEGGCAVPEAVNVVAAVLPEPHAGWLSEVAEALETGQDAYDAWAAAGPAWSAAARALDLAATAGVAPAEALRRAASDLRRDAVAEVEVSASRLGVRLVLPLGLAFLPAFVLTAVVPLVIALMGDVSW